MPVFKLPPGKHSVHRFQSPPAPRSVFIRVESDLPIDVLATPQHGPAQFTSGGNTSVYFVSDQTTNARAEIRPAPPEWALILVNRTPVEAAAVFVEITW
jgi:hypothetical protein